jgi:5-methylcytosine-specific restriction protein B
VTISSAHRRIIDGLTSDHVRAAFKRMDREPIPPRRRATGYEVVYEGKRYPPKYTICLAAEAATGQQLPATAMRGGPEANGILDRLGFPPKPIHSTSKKGGTRRL